LDIDGFGNQVGSERRFFTPILVHAAYLGYRLAFVCSLCKFAQPPLTGRPLGRSRLCKMGPNTFRNAETPSTVLGVVYYGLLAGGRASFCEEAIVIPFRALLQAVCQRFRFLSSTVSFHKTSNKLWMLKGIPKSLVRLCYYTHLASVTRSLPV
jgi:hypothetical protein